MQDGIEPAKEGEITIKLTHQMIVILKEKYIDYPDLTPNQFYYVIGIEADDYRILNDHGKPYLYPSHLFQIVNSNEPEEWITDFGEDGERYSYFPDLNEVGFFEDYFDGKENAVLKFWHNVNQRLSRAA